MNAYTLLYLHSFLPQQTPLGASANAGKGLSISRAATGHSTGLHNPPWTLSTGTRGSLAASPVTTTRSELLGEEGEEERSDGALQRRGADDSDVLSAATATTEATATSAAAAAAAAWRFVALQRGDITNHGGGDSGAVDEDNDETETAVREDGARRHFAAPSLSAPLAFIAAHPSIRATLQQRSAPFTCPHGHRLAATADVRRVPGCGGKSPCGDSRQCVCGGPRSPWGQGIVPVGCVDCVECQQGGALGSRGLRAYCRQQLGEVDTTPLSLSSSAFFCSPSSSSSLYPTRHNMWAVRGSDGCTIGRVRITHDVANLAAVASADALMTFTVTLRGGGGERAVTAARTAAGGRRDDSPRHLCLSLTPPLSESRQRVATGWRSPPPPPPPAPSSSSACAASPAAAAHSTSPMTADAADGHRGSAADVAEDGVSSLAGAVVRQLELASWWLRRCVAVVSAQRSRLGHAEPSVVAVPVTTSPVRGSANRVVAAVAYARSLGSSSEAASASASAACRRVASRVEGVGGAPLHDGHSASPHFPPLRVDVCLQSVLLDAPALTRVVATLRALPCLCCVRRLFVHYEHPLSTTPTAEQRNRPQQQEQRAWAAADRPSSSSLAPSSASSSLVSAAVLSGRGEWSAPRSSPLRLASAAPAPLHLVRGSPLLFRELTPPPPPPLHAVARRGGEHPLSDTAQSSSGVSASCPLPLPAQLPWLYASLVELIVSGVPTEHEGRSDGDADGRGYGHHDGAGGRWWVEELLSQLQSGIAASTTSSSALVGTPFQQEAAPAGASVLCRQTRTPAAPQLRRLVLLEESPAMRYARASVPHPAPTYPYHGRISPAVVSPAVASTSPFTPRSSFVPSPPPPLQLEGEAAALTPHLADSPAGRPVSALRTASASPPPFFSSSSSRSPGNAIVAAATVYAADEYPRLPAAAASAHHHGPPTAPAAEGQPRRLGVPVQRVEEEEEGVHQGESRSAHFAGLLWAPEYPQICVPPLEELYVSRGIGCLLRQQRQNYPPAMHHSGRAAAPLLPLSAARAAAAFPASPLSPPVPWVSCYTTLQALNLSHSTVTDAVCQGILSCLPQLRELHLGWCSDLHDVSAVLQRAASFQLRVLNLVGLRQLTTEALERLCMGRSAAQMHAVEELYVAQCPLSAVGCVAYACPRLRRFQLPDTTMLDATTAVTAAAAAAAEAALCGDDEGDDGATTLKGNPSRSTLTSSSSAAGGDEEGRGPDRRQSWEDGFVYSTPLSGVAASSSLRSVQHASSLSVKGFGGLIPLLSRLLPHLAQLQVHDVQNMLLARADTPTARRRHAQQLWDTADLEEEEAEEEGRMRGGGGSTETHRAGDSPRATAAELKAARASYLDHLQRSEFYQLHRRLPHLRSLYLDGCTELSQLLSTTTTAEGGGGGDDGDAADTFTFGGSALSLACAVHDVHTLERLLTWRRSLDDRDAVGSDRRRATPSSGCCGRSCCRHRRHVPPPPPPSSFFGGLSELRLSGCRSLPVNQMVRVVLRCCPRLRGLAVADTLLTDAALQRLCDGLRGTLTSLDLCGCVALTDVSPLLRCRALRHVRLPGGQGLSGRTMSVECAEGLRGLCGLLGRICPDLRRLQVHSRGSMDAAEVAQVALMGRWVAEVDFSHMAGINGSTMLALSVPTAPSHLSGVLTRVNLSYTAMNNAMLRTLIGGVVGPALQELRLHGCHCVSDVRCVTAACKRMRVLKLSGTSVDAASLSELLEGLPCLTDLDVRYCARVRDVHWLAAALLKASQQAHEQQQQRLALEEARGTRCSTAAAAMRAHRPVMSLAVMHDSVMEEEAAAAAATETEAARVLPLKGLEGVAPRKKGNAHVSFPSVPSASAVSVVAASPLISDGGRLRRSSGGGSALPGPHAGMHTAQSVVAGGVVRRSRTTPLPPSLPSPSPPPLVSASAASAAAARGGGGGGGGGGFLRSLTQVAFGNNHCYLTADTTSQQTARRGQAAAAALLPQPHSSSLSSSSPSSGPLFSHRSGADASATGTHATPPSAVVLQEAVPGLFAVLAQWRPQTCVLVLLRPGSMGREEWREVEEWMPHLRIQEMAV